MEMTNDPQFTPGQRVLAGALPATVLPADHPFTAWCQDAAPYFAGTVCVELDEQDMPANQWKPIPGMARFSEEPHKFRVYAPSDVIAFCPGGCGCRLGTKDADRSECGCDGGCCS